MLFIELVFKSLQLIDALSLLRKAPFQKLVKIMFELTILENSRFLSLQNVAPFDLTKILTLIESQTSHRYWISQRTADFYFAKDCRN